MSTVPMISAGKRNALPTDKFALPGQRKYPVDTAARTRNAAARLEQAKKAGKVTPSDYAAAKKKIAAAAKRFGIESSYNARQMDLGIEDVHAPGPAKVRPAALRRGLHLQIGPNGSIEVRHSMKALMFDALDIPALTDHAPRIAEIEAALTSADETTAATLREEVATIKAADNKPVWIQIAKCGTFRGHSAGPFELTPAVFEDIVRNFTAVDKGQVPVDFEHACEADASEGSIPQDGAPAQGWVRALDNRGNAGLWGLVEWFAKARTYIREGKYKAVSPAIRFGAKHPESGAAIGARLTSVALTNRPFLRGMQAITARDNKETMTMSLDAPMTAHGEFMPRLRAALRLGEIATHQECKDQLDRLRSMCMGAADPTGIHEGVNLGEYVAPMKALMNMPANATLAELFDAIEEMVDAAIERHEAMYHTTDDTASMADTDTQGDTAMADQKNLKDIETERDGALAKLRDAEAREAGLSLRLKDAEAKAAAAEQTVAAKDAEIATLRADAAKRAEADLSARVEDAFATYKDLRKLTDADKKAMRIVLTADPQTFDTLYPRVAPNHQHLMRDLSGTTPGTGAAPANLRPAANLGAHRESFQDASRRLLSDKLAKGMKYEDAIVAANSEARALAS